MTFKIKRNLKMFFLFFGVKITRRFKLVKALRKNVFNKKKCGKKVLISYITSPFINKNDLSHTNLLECYTAAEIFNELGYCVDVIDYDSVIRVDYSRYDIIYGLGDILEKSFHFKKNKIKRILYATGCNPIFSNLETLARAVDFYNFHGLFLLESTRFVEKSFFLQSFLSDGIIVLGNNFVLDTYKRYAKDNMDRFSNLDAFFYDVHDTDLKNKNFLEAKNHFLWFGSLGAIHKGLDILIDIFSKREDIYLHICGRLDSEKNFLNYYNDIFLHSKNIINHGFISIKSEEFVSLMNKCAFVISPSASEGGAPAVLNVVANGGLIPIITKSSGLDIDDFGIIIKKPKRELVENAINEALRLETARLFNMSELGMNRVRQRYTISRYRDNLKSIINNIIEKSV